MYKLYIVHRDKKIGVVSREPVSNPNQLNVELIEFLNSTPIWPGDTIEIEEQDNGR